MGVFYLVVDVLSGARFLVVIDRKLFTVMRRDAIGRSG